MYTMIRSNDEWEEREKDSLQTIETLRGINSTLNEALAAMAQMNGDLREKLKEREREIKSLERDLKDEWEGVGF